ncbi:hypothetical protein P168DRAFT_329712 [Aspergillus campestris IBT 28561]|uniref:F-box domain-containing protein n=1 Tax=Aspergillus campestris (strain IBT 28561) TaxID=1392248 RepID=A0A2I1CVZ2_ASPC2|nr:uncharacterized protein P168DRAFT_329712 [Aspergillus campestris IBT 28561]PKY01796.1 hypothetical protein P168DRAFT_329712 [Aspergillus campestris IBT 28561]
MVRAVYVDTICDDAFGDLPTVWLQPCSRTLRHLTLSSTQYFGFFPRLPLQGVKFDRLQALSLSKFTFGEPSTLRWVLSHEDTLTELSLDRFAIIYAATFRPDILDDLHPEGFDVDRDHGGHVHITYDGRWHACFDLLKVRLPHLRRFHFGLCVKDWRDGRTLFAREGHIDPGFYVKLYMVYRSGGFGYTTVCGFTEERYISNPEGWTTGWEAFLSLHTTVCRRCAGIEISEETMCPRIGTPEDIVRGQEDDTG